MSHTQKMQQARKLELISIILMMIFLLFIADQFKTNCENRRGSHSIVKSPDQQTLKTVSIIRSID